jgi:arylsulfatase A-like enzyme
VCRAPATGHSPLSRATDARASLVEVHKRRTTPPRRHIPGFVEERPQGALPILAQSPAWGTLWGSRRRSIIVQRPGRNAPKLPMRLIIALFAGILLAPGCSTGEAAAPAGLQRTDLRAWTDLSSMLDPDFVPQRFDEQQERVVRALWVDGPAQVLVEASGTGTVVATTRRDGREPIEIGRFQLAKKRGSTRVFDLPDFGPRELELVLDGGPDVVWSEITLIEAPSALTDEEIAGKETDRAAPLDGRNVILIVADSLHAKHLSTYGYERETSPAIDRLAQNGVRFDKAYSQTSWTLSSISSLFTSQQQERHGVLELNQRLDERFDTLAELFSAKGYRTVGLIQNGILWKETGLGQGFDEYTTFPYDGDGVERIVTRAQEVLQEVSDRPLFLYVHFTPPHQPYQPPTVYSDAFVDADYDGPVDGSIRSCAVLNHEKPPVDGPDVRHLLNLYDGNIRFVDDQIGRVLDTAQDKAELEDSLVILTSDHGEAFFQHGAQGHNAHVFEEMVHVPMIFSAPGSTLFAGGTVQTPVSLLDIMPTLIDLVGLAPLEKKLDGTSLAPFLGADPPHRPERTLFYSSRYKDELDRVQFAVRSDGYKLVVKRGNAALYDMERDHKERNDVSLAHPIRAQALWCRLGEWWRTARAESIHSSSSAPTDEVLEQLKALGYVDVEEH